MICGRCQIAGKFNTYLQSDLEPAAKSAMKMYAMAFHRDCLGGSRCDCQHVVAKVLSNGH